MPYFNLAVGPRWRWYGRKRTRKVGRTSTSMLRRGSPQQRLGRIVRLTTHKVSDALPKASLAMQVAACVKNGACPNSGVGREVVLAANQTPVENASAYRQQGDPGWVVERHSAESTA